MPKRGQYKANATHRSKLQRKYNSKPEQKKNRAERNRARRAAIKAGTVKKGDKTKDIGHSKKGAKGSTRVQSVKSNRAHGGRIGDKKGKGKRRSA